ncbi:MAG: YdcF family protein [Butyrivibrio sp.]|nr:YdcF family protein [Butyrivibrio sp.]
MKKKLFSSGFRIIWFVLMVLALAYAVMVYMVGSGTFSFVIWLAGAAFFCACFFLAGNGRWGKVPKIARYVIYTCISFVLAVFVVCQVGILTHFSDKGEPDLDYIILLGAQMRSSGPSVIYRYRLDKAMEYLEENPDTIIVTTGGQGTNENVSEGRGGEIYLLSHGVNEAQLMSETMSKDTVENIEFALEMIEESEVNKRLYQSADNSNADIDGDFKEDRDNLRIGIVTNGFHVFRGIHIAKGLTDADVCGIAAYMQPQYIPNNLVRETLGIIRDFVAGRMKF